MPKRALAPRILCAGADSDAPGAKTEAVKDGIAPLAVPLAAYESDGSGDSELWAKFIAGGSSTTGDMAVGAGCVQGA